MMFITVSLKGGPVLVLYIIIVNQTVKIKLDKAFTFTHLTTAYTI